MGRSTGTWYSQVNCFKRDRSGAVGAGETVVQGFVERMVPPVRSSVVSGGDYGPGQPQEEDWEGCKEG